MLLAIPFPSSYQGRSLFMAVSYKERLAQFSKAYAIHRPLVQRCLNVALIFYALGSTYRGLSSRPPSSSGSKKGKRKAKDDVATQETRTAKPPRVAVSHPQILLLPYGSMIPLGRRCVLSTTINDSSDSYPKCSIKGSAAPDHAF